MIKTDTNELLNLFSFHCGTLYFLPEIQLFILLDFIMFIWTVECAMGHRDFSLPAYYKYMLLIEKLKVMVIPEYLLLILIS